LEQELELVQPSSSLVLVLVLVEVAPMHVAELCCVRTNEQNV